MAILKNNTQANFTIINNSVLRDPELSIKDRGMLCTLIGLPNDWEFSIEGLAKILPDGYQAIHGSIKRLEELGYLTRTKQRRPDGRFESVIEITPEGRKDDRHGKPAADNPRREIHGGKPTADNQRQYNNKDIKLNSNKEDIKSINHSINPSDIKTDQMDSGEKEAVNKVQRENQNSKPNHKRNDRQNERVINPIFMENTRKQIQYEQLQEDLTEAEMRYADRMLTIIAHKKSNPKGNNDLKISGRYIPRGEIMAHVLNYRYEEVYAVAKNMAASNVPVDKPDSYYLTALDRQLKINSPEIYDRIDQDDS